MAKREFFFSERNFAARTMHVLSAPNWTVNLRSVHIHIKGLCCCCCCFKKDWWLELQWNWSCHCLVWYAETSKWEQRDLCTYTHAQETSPRSILGSFGEVNICGLTKVEQVKYGRLSFCSLAVFIACIKRCLCCFWLGFGGFCFWTFIH